MKLRLLPVLLFLVNFHEAFSQSKQADSTGSGPGIYRTHRIPFTERPVVDGKLNDACWKTIDWSGNYTQWIPNEGAQPSQPTQLKILYDDKNIYNITPEVSIQYYGSPFATVGKIFRF